MYFINGWRAPFVALFTCEGNIEFEDAVKVYSCTNFNTIFIKKEKYLTFPRDSLILNSFYQMFIVQF